MRLFLLISLSFYAALTLGQEHWQDKLSDKLWVEIDNKGGAEYPVMVLLSDQLVFADNSIKGRKEAKGSGVYRALAEHADLQQINVKAELQSMDVSFRSYSIVNMISTTLDLAAIERIASLPSVGRILHNGPMEMIKPIPSQQLSLRSDSVEYGISLINADSLWCTGVTGHGAVVGGQDTGYEWDLPQIVGQYRGYDSATGIADHNYHWHDAIHEPVPATADSLNPCGYSTVRPCDDHNHGTHTMGTMVGVDQSTLAFGVAPDAKWIGCRNMDRGNGIPSTYIECFEFFLAPTDLSGSNPDPTMAPHVINNSWACTLSEGCDIDNFEVMEIAVQNLRAAGVVVVASAGNSGPGCHTVSTPAAIYEGAFTVGAVDSRDTIANFSSRGVVTADESLRMKPNVVAPGVGVRSIVRGGDYRYYNGTSMAGPHVAGAIALLISAVPELAGQVDLIEQILEETAFVIASDQQCMTDSLAYPNPTYGWGRIDILAAVQYAREIMPTAVKDVASSSYVIYPNPTSDRLFFVGDARSTVDVVIRDIAGRLIAMHQDISPGESMDVSGLKAGSYLVTIAGASPSAVTIAR